MVYEKKDKPAASDDAYSGESKATHPGRYGDHPAGGAFGAAIGATAGAVAAGAAQGAAAGTAAGIPGMVAGIAIGGVVGALAGKGAAQVINPTTEDAYWEDNFHTRDYVGKDETYDIYRPAYRHGVESYTKYEGRSFDDVEPRLSEDWKASENSKTLPWDKARPAAKDAYDRLSERGKDAINDNKDE